MTSNHNKTLYKRIILAVLCACLVPVGAFADDQEDKSKSEQSTTSTQPSTDQETPSSTLSSTVGMPYMTAEKFVQEAVVCSQKEVYLSQMAQQKAQNEEIKQLSQRLIKDHTQANQQLTQIAQAKGINLPPANMFASLSATPGIGGTAQPGQSGTLRGESSSTTDSPGDTPTPSTSSVDQSSSTTTPPSSSTSQPGTIADQPTSSSQTSTAPGKWSSEYGTSGQVKPQDRQMIQHLQALSGSEFDKAFIRHMAQDHAKGIRQYEQASRQLQDTEIKNYIAQTLPKLREHFSQAQQIARNLGVTVPESPTRQDWQRDRLNDREGQPRSGSDAGSDVNK